MGERGKTCLIIVFQLCVANQQQETVSQGSSVAKNIVTVMPNSPPKYPTPCKSSYVFFVTFAAAAALFDIFIITKGGL